jgi:glycosyltransferase involved in cell wall biosynthesis
VYIYPKGNKFSGQSTIGDNSKKFDIYLTLPIYFSEQGKFSYLINYFRFLKQVYKASSLQNNFTVSIALSTSYLLRIVPLLFIIKNRLVIECHSGPSINLSSFSAWLLKLIGGYTKELHLLGKIQSLEDIFIRCKSDIIYFNNSTSIQVPILKPHIDRLYDFGFLALNIESKGYENFIKVMEKARAHNPSVKVVLAGPFHRSSFCSSSHTLENFKSNINRFQDAGGVYIDSVSSDEKSDFFGQIKSFVFLSSFPGEAQPMVLLEAQMCGCKILSLMPGFVSEMNLSDTKFFSSVRDLEDYVSA